MDFQQEYFFHALHTLNVKGRGSHRGIFVPFLCFFGSRESERSAFSTELFGRQGASEECGKIKQI